MLENFRKEVEARIWRSGSDDSSIFWMVFKKLSTKRVKVRAWQADKS